MRVGNEERGFNVHIVFFVRERFIKKLKKKLIKISFRYVRVAENFEKIVFFLFYYFTISASCDIWGKKGNKLVFTGRRYV